MNLQELTLQELYKLHFQVTLEVLSRLWWIYPLLIIAAIILIKPRKES